MAAVLQQTEAGRAIVLVGPRYPENIGAAARVGCNFGIDRLIVVADAPPDQERMLKMATHKAAHLIRDMELHRDLPTALAPYHFVVGTTARRGRHRTLERPPREVFADLTTLAAEGNRVALLFGPESTGLSNDDLDLCQFTSTIDTADFSSLNLAQAVAIHCYELHAACGRHCPRRRTVEYANSNELEGMYAHIDQVLAAIDFLKHGNHLYWMRYIRQFLGRVRLSKREASLIRGVCRKFLWFNSHDEARRRELIGERQAGEGEVDFQGDAEYGGDGG